MNKRFVYLTRCNKIGLIISICLVCFIVSSCASGKHGLKSAITERKDSDPFFRINKTKMNSPEEKMLKTNEKEESFGNEKSPPNEPIRPPKQQAEPNLPSAAMSHKIRPSKEKKDPGPSVHVEFAFDNADLYEVLDVTLYELFNVNYMVDPSIKAKVTFHFSGNYTKDQFINILNNVLQLNNLAIAMGPGNILKIVRRNASAGFGNALLSEEGELEPVGDITRLIRLRYISAATAAKNIRPFLSKGAVIVQNTVTNSLMITDTPGNLAKAAGMLGAMDVAYFTDISWRVFPVKEVDAADIAKDVSKILKTRGLYNRPGIDKGSFEIFPIQTMNAILVVTRWPSIMKLVEDWITAMDHAEDAGTNVFVYFVENGDATELADILKQLYGGTVKNSSKKVAIVKPTAKPSEKIVAGERSGEVAIIPNETNNAIVFKATARDYRIIRNVLKELDIVPRQVLINVVIAEILLGGELRYGVEWFLRGHTGDYTHQAVLDDGVLRPITTGLGSMTGFTYAVFDGTDFLRGLVSALGEDSEVNILSSPNILAVDNKEAVIEVAEQIPLPTGETVSTTGTVTTTIQYRDTGVLLTVTPHISSTGLVKMELSQEVSELGRAFPDLKANSILNRKAKTSLVIEDGQTIIIGGLMKSKLDTSGSGIPFLRSIPILGYLFGGTRKKMEKTELIFLITPNVIKSRNHADLITREFSRRVESVKELIEKKEF